MTCTALFPNKDRKKPATTRCHKSNNHRGPHSHTFTHPPWTISWWDELDDGYRNVGVRLEGERVPPLCDAYDALLRMLEKR
jgi:hypothetical protein